MKLIEKRQYRTGFCGLTNPASSHARCPKQAGDLTCTCACHTETGDPACCSADDHALGVHAPGRA